MDQKLYGCQHHLRVDPLGGGRKTGFCQGVRGREKPKEPNKRFEQKTCFGCSIIWGFLEGLNSESDKSGHIFISSVTLLYHKSFRDAITSLIIFKILNSGLNFYAWFKFKNSGKILKCSQYSEEKKLFKILKSG